MISKTNKIPDASLLKPDENSFNYIDCFQTVVLTENRNVDKTEFINMFINSGPKWGDFLMSLRDKIVGIFGLKTSKNNPKLQSQKQTEYLPGEQVGIFKLFEKSDYEYLLGENDKHLNFRVSILALPIENEGYKTELKITTAVQFNNLFGNLYFFPVKPIHKLLVRSSLKNIVKEVNTNKSIE